MTCAPSEDRSAWASTQSLHCALNRAQYFFMRTVETLIRLGRCLGWSESSLGAQVILLVLSCGSSHIVGIHENHLCEVILMNTNNICFYGELKKLSFTYHQIHNFSFSLLEITLCVNWPQIYYVSPVAKWLIFFCKIDMGSLKMEKLVSTCSSSVTFPVSWTTLMILSSDRYAWVNSADPDQLLLEEQSDQGLHCLPFRLHCLDSLLYGRAT